MKHRIYFFVVCLCLLAACTPNAAPTNTPAPTIQLGNAEAGRVIFEQGTLDIQPCSACHSLDGSTDLLGPTLQGIAITAATRVAGQPADVYLLTSMKTPNEFLVPGYAPDLMPAVKATDAQYADLLAYLFTLK